MEVGEAYMEVVEVSMEEVEASTEVVGASATSMEAFVEATSVCVCGSAEWKPPWKFRRICVYFHGIP